MVNFTKKPHYSYEDLLEIIRILRSPEGCPWDRVQTHASIRRGLLEESYEAAEAIDLDSASMLREELGDVLMQVVFHADIERDRGRFTMEDVVDGVVRKLLFRHPHVFAGAGEENPESVLESWEQLKREEKGQKTTAEAMDSVARSLPGQGRRLYTADDCQKARLRLAGYFRSTLQAGGRSPGTARGRGMWPRCAGGTGRRTVCRREGGTLRRGRSGGGHSRHLRKIHSQVSGRGKRRPGAGPGGQ